MENDQGFSSNSDKQVVIPNGVDKHESTPIGTNTTEEMTPTPVHNSLEDDKENVKSGDKTGNDQSKPCAETNVKACVGKRVRFSICEYITETLVDENWGSGAHENPVFENEKDMGNRRSDGDDEEGGNKQRYIGGRLRRDSVHPLVGPQKLNQSDKVWEVNSPEDEFDNKDEGEPWSELSTKQKIFRVLIGIGKFLSLLVLLYFFVCSLDLLSLGFRLIGGSTAGEIFRQSSILQNPIVGLMIGILTTVLVQSSSTSTSIIVGMVAAGFMEVRLAIPPIMGANIGTSITNTIVSFTQAGNRNQFRRAFAGATILDMFNWLTVVVLLPVEVIFGYLYHVSKATVDLIIPDSQSGGEIQVLSVITKPFVDLIVQLNDTVLECWATPNCTDADDASLIKEFCSTAKTEIYVQGRVIDVNGKEILNVRDVARQEDLQRCDFLFAGTSLRDAAVGGIVLASSLVVLCFCLVMIVKLLSSVLEGQVSKIIKHTLNADIPYVPWITGYIAILIGAVMTFLVQSSSVFTSALTPLVGLGVISLDRVYPLTLGANIGTTTTALLASMAADGKSLHPSLQIALCHFFFNITGVLLFYPVPFLRFPIGMAKALGNTTAKYRWFAIVYLVSMFAILPAVFILLSLAGSIYVVVLVSIVGAIILIVIIITIIQRKIPQILPEPLRTWKFLPEPMRSLRPYDSCFSKIACCSKEDDEDEDNGAFAKNTDDDFVFLTGNNIPPPDGYIENSPAQPTSITRIVPTRVIRNISNSSSDYSQTNGNGVVGNNSHVHNGNVSKDLPDTKNDATNAQNGISNMVNNSLPMPDFIDESIKVEDEQKDKSQNYSNGKPNSGVNLSFSSSLDSFHV